MVDIISIFEKNNLQNENTFVDLERYFLGSFSAFAANFSLYRV